MSNEISFDGVRYVSASDAASRSGFTRDYIARLCRDGKVRGRRVGKNWYVENKSFDTFLVTQEYAKSRRNESLARERVQEYQSGEVGSVAKSIPAAPAVVAPVIPAAPVRPLRAPEVRVPRPVQQPSNEIHTKLLRALSAKTSAAVESASSLSYAPGGFTSAALQTAHIPAYTVTPLMEFAHKLIALTLTLALVLGTYAAVDPQYARYAIGSMHDQAESAINSYRAATGGIGGFADRAQQQVAIAAENPQVAAAGLAGLFTESLPNMAADLARALNTHVNDLVYAIAFPQNVLRPSGIAANSSDSGAVSVEVQPYAAGTKSAGGATASTQGPNAASSSNRADESTRRPSGTTTTSGNSIASGAPTIINNYNTIQEVSPQLLAQSGGITQAQLNEQLNQLDNKLSARMYSLTSAQSTVISQNYNVTSQSNAINKLVDVTITNPTLTGGTISGTSVSATGLTVSGDTSLAGATLSGNLTVGGSITLSASSTALTAPNAVFTNATSTNFFATLANITTGVITNLTSTIGAITDLTVTNSTTTNAYVSNANIATASTTDLTFVTAVGGNATTTNFFATTASSTNLFATTANFGTLSIGTTSIAGLATFGNGFLSQASSTIGDGTQAGGLTINGGATTTGNLYVGGNSTVIGNSTSNLLTINSSVNSHLIPNGNKIFDLGSPAFFWRNIYVDTLTTNFISAASTSIGGTNSNSLTINADNATPDTEDMSLIFFRGTVVPNAVIAWNSATSAKRFEFNQASYFSNLSGSTTQPTFVIKGVPGQTGDIFQIASSSGSNLFRVGSDGATTIGGSLTVNGALTTTLNASTTLFSSYGPAYFGSTATSTFSTTGFLTLPSGFASYASSTIGNGAQAGGLTVSGGATTTGNAYFAGNVGIGTTSPYGLFSVSGSNNPLAVFQSTNSVANVILNNTGTGSHASLVLKSNNVTAGAIESSDTGVEVGYGSSYGSNIALHVNSSNGNVGIGTTSPTSLLSLAGSAAVVQNIDFTDSTSYGKYQFSQASNGNTLASLQYLGSGFPTTNRQSNLELVNNSASGAIAFRTSGSEVARVTSAGFFGIGTTTPWGKLSVTGAGTGTGINFLLADSNNSPIFKVLDNGTVTLTGSLTSSALTVNGTAGSATSTISTALSISPLIDFNPVNAAYQPTANRSWMRIAGGAGNGISFNSGGTDGLFLNHDTSAKVIIADGGGNVGIGSSTPFAKLSVKGAGSTTGVNFQTTNSSNAPLFSILDNGNVGIGTTSPAYPLSIEGATANIWLHGTTNAAALRLQNNNATTWDIFERAANNSLSLGSFLDITTAGNVGIGTTTPSASLQVENAASAPQILVSTSVAGNSGLGIRNLSQQWNLLLRNDLSQSFEIRNLTSGTDPFVITTGGNIGVGTTNPTWAKLQVTQTVGSTAFSATTTNGGISLIPGFSDNFSYVEDSSLNGLTFAELGAGNLPSFNVLATKSTFNGNVGIGTTSPVAALQVAGTVVSAYGSGFESLVNTGGYGAGASGFYPNKNVIGLNDTAIRYGAGNNNFVLLHGTAKVLTADQNGNVGIGTTTPWALLSLVGSNTTSGSQAFAVTNSASTTNFAIDNAGFISAGASQSGTPSGIFTIDASSSTTTISNLSLGNLIFDTNAGNVTLSDIPVDSNAALGVQQSQAINIGGTSVLTASGISNGSGGVTNLGVAIGTSTPWGALSIWGADTSASTQAFGIANNASTTLFAVFNNGNVGIGTTSPSGTFGVSGSTYLGGSLTVQGAAASPLVRIVQNTATAAMSLSRGLTNSSFGFGPGIDFLNNDSAGTDYTAARILPGFNANTAGSATGYLTFQTTNAGTLAERVRIDSAGNVGIGTTSPYAKLSVAGSSGGTTPLFAISTSTAAGATSTALLIDSSGNLSLNNGATFTLGTTPANTRVFTANGSLLINTGSSATTHNDLNIGGIGGWTAGESHRINFLFDSTPDTPNIVNTIESSYDGVFTYMNFRNFNNGGNKTNSLLTIRSDGNIGIGTTSPSALLALSANSVNGVGAPTMLFTIASTTAGTATSTLFSIDNVGNINAPATNATTTLAGGLTVGNGSINYDLSSGLTSINNLQLGAFNFDSDAGIVTWADMPVTSGSSAGTVNSYSANINGNPLLTIFSTADGAGGLSSSGVGIGTTSPLTMLSVQGNAGANDVLNIASSTGASMLYVNAAGNVGIGTASPQGILHVRAGNSSTAILPGLIMGNENTNTGGLSIDFRNHTDTTINTARIIAQRTSAANSNSTLQFWNFFNGILREAMRISELGNIGIGTTSPYAKFSISANSGDTNTTLFAIASSTPSATTTLMSVLANGNVGIGTASPSYSLDISNGSIGLVLGADSNATTRTNGASKVARFGTPHWTNSQAPAAVFVASNTITSNLLDVGGGTSLMNAATQIDFFTAANSTTLTGTSRMTINSVGNIGIGTTTPWALLSLVGANTTSGSQAFAVTNSASTTNFAIDNAGFISAGASQTGTPSGIFTIDASSSTTTISNLSIGNINFDTDAGMVALANIPLSSNPAAGTIESQSINIGDTPVFTVYGENDGATASPQNTRVGIGTTSPAYLLDVYGFINTANGGYKQEGNTVLYASTTNFSTFVGQAGGTWATATSTVIRNTAVGYQALNATPTSGSVANNTAMGYQSLLRNTSGGSNSAFGDTTLNFNTSGSNNTAFGVASLYNNTTGIQNIGNGPYSLYNNTTGGQNTANGYEVSYYNGSATSTVAIGFRAAKGTALYSAQGYTAIGTLAGTNITTGADYNTLLGYQAGYNITTGSKNINVGSWTTTANANITTGSNNIVIGNDVQAPSATASNQLNIGNLLFGTGLSGTGTTIAGNIGIGTTTPNQKFDVNGVIQSSAGTGFAAVQLVDWAHTSYRQSLNNDGTLLFQSSSNAFQSQASTVMAFNGGNVGIGTSTPSSKLEVNGDIKITAGSGGKVIFGDGTVLSSNAVNGSAGLTSWGDINFQTGGAIAFQTGNGTATSSKMVLSNSGNFGIGLTLPTYALDVVGAGHFSTFVDAPYFVATSSSATSTFVGGITGPGSFTVQQSTGNVGIGTANPTQPLDITKAATANNILRLYSGTLGSVTAAPNLGGLATFIADGTTTNTAVFQGYSGTIGQTDGADNVFYSSRGTPAAPTQLSTNDYLGLLDFRGRYNGASSGARAFFGARAAESWSSSTNNGTFFSWSTTPVGSGTLAEVMRLQASGGLSLGNSTYLAADPGAGGAIFQGSVGIGTTTPTGKFAIHLNSGETYPGNFAFNIASSTASATTTLFSVDNQGNTSAGTLNLTANVAPANAGLYSSGAGVLDVYAGGSIVAFSNSSVLFKRVPIGNTSSSFYLNINSASASVPTLVPNRSDTTTGIGASAVGNLSFITSGTDKLELLNNGNLGLGTTSPFAKFSISANSGDTNTTVFSIASSTASATSTLFNVSNVGDTTVFGKFTVQGAGIWTAAINNPTSGNNSSMSFGTNGASISRNVADANSALIVNQINTSSTGDILTLQAGGVTKVSFEQNGNIGVGTTTPYAQLSLAGLAGGTTPLFAISTSTAGFATTTALAVDSNGNFNFGSSGNSLNFYNTADQTTNYERTNFSWGSSIFTIANQAGGTGVIRRLDLGTGGTTRIGGWLLVANGLSASGSMQVSVNGSLANQTNQTVGGAASQASGNWTGININPTFTQSSTAGYAGLLIQPTETSLGSGNHFLIQAGTSTAPNLFTVNNAGSVGIATSTPFSTFTVGSGNIGAFNGAICADNGGLSKCYGALTAGVVYGDSSSFTASDLAENYPTKDKTLAAGEIIALDQSATTTVSRAQPGGRVFGVVSTQPGVLLGDEATSSVPVALAGRVPVKVNLDGGPIQVGDAITVSTVAGVGMKATTTAYTIGIALDNYTAPTASSSILVFIQPELSIAGMHQQALAALAEFGSTTPATVSTGSFMDTFLKNMFAQMTQWFASAQNGITKLFAGEVHTGKLCVSDGSSETCVTKAQLDALLAGAATASTGSTSSSTSGSSGSGATTSATPVISLAGNNPAHVAIGASYVDLGASITGPASDVNLGISAAVDGGATTTVDAISIDTSVAGTHKIVFSVTDQNGLTGTATRTVIVDAPASAAPTSDASSTPPVSNASSTPPTSDASSTPSTP